MVASLQLREQLIVHLFELCRTLIKRLRFDHFDALEQTVAGGAFTLGAWRLILEIAHISSLPIRADTAEDCAQARITRCEQCLWAQLWRSDGSALD